MLRGRTPPLWPARPPSLLQPEPGGGLHLQEARVQDGQHRDRRLQGDLPPEHDLGGVAAQVCEEKLDLSCCLESLNVIFVPECLISQLIKICKTSDKKCSVNNKVEDRKHHIDNWIDVARQ